MRGDDLAIGVPGERRAVGAVNVLHGRSSSGLSTSLDQLWAQDSPGIRNIATPFDAFGSALASGDFNGDRRADLAVGVPSEGLAATNEGAVNVIYGTASGLSAIRDQFWTQDRLRNPVDVADAEDRFGSALAAGDFNADRHADLVVGVPEEDVYGADDTGAVMRRDAGAVNVLYGSPSGLSSTGNQFWEQNAVGVAGGVNFPGDRFGHAVTSGDFNGDGNDDLAIGAPFDNDAKEFHIDTGAVSVLYGTRSGLSRVRAQRWTQPAPSRVEVDDQFGFALAAGDFNRDCCSDLAVGVKDENLDPRNSDAGAVDVLFGTPEGLSEAGHQYFDQDSEGVQGVGEVDDHFGFALAAGDFNGDVRDDLAVGVPNEDPYTTFPIDPKGWETSPTGRAGAVNVLYGRSFGLTPVGFQLWDQGRAHVSDEPEVEDHFGAALAAGDYNSDGEADLAVGVPEEDVHRAPVPPAQDGGAVNVLYGGGGRNSVLSAAGSQLWHQLVFGVLGVAELRDRFGFALASGDFNGDAPR